MKKYFLFIFTLCMYNSLLLSMKKSKEMDFSNFQANLIKEEELVDKETLMKIRKRHKSKNITQKSKFDKVFSVKIKLRGNIPKNDPSIKDFHKFCFGKKILSEKQKHTQRKKLIRKELHKRANGKPKPITPIVYVLKNSLIPSNEEKGSFKDGLEWKRGTIKDGSKTIIYKWKSVKKL